MCNQLNISFVICGAIKPHIPNLQTIIDLQRQELQSYQQELCHLR